MQQQRSCWWPTWAQRAQGPRARYTGPVSSINFSIIYSNSIIFISNINGSNIVTNINFININGTNIINISSANIISTSDSDNITCTKVHTTLQVVMGTKVPTCTYVLGAHVH